MIENESYKHKLKDVRNKQEETICEFEKTKRNLDDATEKVTKSVHIHYNLDMESFM